MTARVTTLKGVDAGAYYVEALPSYYLDADEPPGRWHGRGADMLGLRNEVRVEDFLDIMTGVHPGSRGVLLGRAYGESSVRGFDITANGPVHHGRPRTHRPAGTGASLALLLGQERDSPPRALDMSFLEYVALFDEQKS